MSRDMSPDEARPEAAPTLPEAAPTLPEAAPTLPEAAPTLPEAAPTLPEAAPTLPEAAPTLSPEARRAGAVAAGAVAVGIVAELQLGVPWAILAGIVCGVGFVIHDARWWHEFWFGSVSGALVAAWRTGLGLLITLYATSMAWDVTRLYGDDSLYPDPQYFVAYRFGLLRYWHSPGAVWTVWVALLACGLLIAAGRGGRVAGPVAWYAISSLHQANPIILNSADDLIRLWAFFFALFSVFAPREAIRLRLWGAAGDGTRTWPEVPRWLLRLVQLQLTVIYPATFLAKIAGATWRDGTAALWAMGLEDFQRFPVPGFVTNSLVLGAVFTWGSLLVEFVIGALLWYKPTRKLGIAIGLVMHVSFAWAMSLGFFTVTLALGYVAFFEDTAIESALRRASTLTWRRRGELARL